jgi:hypothetical protein
MGSCPSQIMNNNFISPQSKPHQGGTQMNMKEYILIVFNFSNVTQPNLCVQMME